MDETSNKPVEQSTHQEQVNRWVNEGFKQLNETQTELKQYSEELIDKIRENPMKAVLIAGGIGMLLSALLKK